MTWPAIGGFLFAGALVAAVYAYAWVLDNLDEALGRENWTDDADEDS